MAIVTFKKGSTAQNNLYKGQNGELTIDTTKKTLRIHDGSTTGGFEIALADLSNTAPITNNINLNGNDITGISNLSSNGTLLMLSPTDFEELVSFLNGFVAQNDIQVVSETPDSYTISTIHDSETTFYVESSTGNINTDGDIYVTGSAHVDGIVYADLGISTHNGDLVLSSQTGQISIENNMNIEGNINITGNFTIQGETATINSNVVVIDDPIFVLGGQNSPLFNDGKDRGIEFKWNDGTNSITPDTLIMGQTYYIVSLGDTDFTQIGAASNTVGLSFVYNGDLSQVGTTGNSVISTALKIGFFGYDNSTGKFIFIQDATNSNDVYSGTPGNVIFGGGEFTNLSVTNTITGNIDHANSLTNARNISLSGAVTGSVSFDGTDNVDIATSIGDINITLGTQTTGDYVATLSASNGIDISNNTGAGANPTIGLTSGIASIGTYQSVTVDTYGRVTAGTNPTSLSSYGITDGQPLDATLTALAGVTTSANKVIYATGEDTFSTTDLTSYGRTLIGLADASALKTNLSLVIGTDVQAYDGDLNAIASLSDGGTGYLKKTGANTWSLDTSTFVATTGDQTIGGTKTFSSILYANGNISTSSGNLTISSTGGTTTLSDNVTVTGNLTVNGTTTTINSTTQTIDDPIITLGGDTAPASDDNKDRGVEFRWHNGTSAKVGFFGYDDSLSVFTFIPDATNTSEVFSGTVGNVKFGTGTFTDLSVTNTITGSVSGSAATLTTSRTISLGGDLSGSASFNGSSDITITATIATNSVALGTDTTGDYVTNLVAGAGITLTNNSGEGATPTVALTSGVIASIGTYKSVTVDTYGRVTAGTNPTTLSGYGITDAQALDATLTALAGVSTSANSLIYATASDTFTTTTLSAFGRTLIDDADAATARSTLGLGTIATAATTDYVDVTNSQSIAGTKTFTGSIAFSGSGAIAISSSSTAVTQTALDNSTKIATTAYVQTATRVAVNTQTTSYTLVIGDEGKMIEFNSASNLTLTIPANSSVAFPVGTQILISRYGTGTVQVLITTDTLRSASSNRFLASQYSGATLVKRTSTEWYLFGDLSAT